MAAPASSLVDAAGGPVGQAASSAADGAFTLAAPPPTGGPYELRARFATAGKAFTWRAALDPAATDAATLDEASTIATERAAQTPAAATRLATALRAALGPDVLPYTADDSRDRGPALDQLLLDREDLRAAAAAAAPGLERPRATWTVDTPVSSALLAGTARGERLEDPTGVQAFLPDPTDGVVVTLSGATGIRLVLLRADAKPALVAQLPREVGAQVRLARGADGRIRVAARMQDTLEIRVWEVAADGTVTRLPGVLATMAALADRDFGQIAVDAQGRVYMADTRAHVVRRLAPADAVSTILAGTERAASSADGPGADARFKGPKGVAIAPDGALYVADTGNQTLRRVAADGAVTTVAGRADEAAYRNGRGQAARLGSPEALAFGPDGDVFVLDRDARRVRRLSRSGSVFLVAGSGETGNADGDGPQASFRKPAQLALGPDGSLLLRDTLGDDGEFVIRRMKPPAP